MYVEIQHRSETPIPPSNQVWIFADADNNNVITVKNTDCEYSVLNGTSSPTFLGDCDCACELAKDVINAANCSLEKGIITPAEYMQLLNNVNFYVSSVPNQETGACSNSVSTSPALSIVARTTIPLCHDSSDGSVVFDISGGEGPYTTVIDGNLDPTALSAGSYTATVTDSNGKTAGVTFIVEAPDQITGTFTNNGATLLMTPAGGSAPYTYAWTGPTGITGNKEDFAITTPGTYTVVVTDANGCSVELSTLLS